MALLRIKGGFFVSMLRETLGHSAFAHLLGSLAERRDDEPPLDLYTVIGLAGRIARRPLFWFAEQWAHRTGALEIGVERPIVIPAPGPSGQAVSRTRCTLLLTGSFTPGVPVPVAVESADGRRIHTSCRLDAGRGQIDVTTPFRPDRLVVDPETRWFLASTEHLHALPAPADIALPEESPC
jgi:hypothetical protein